MLPKRSHCAYTNRLATIKKQNNMNKILKILMIGFLLISTKLSAQILLTTSYENNLRVSPDLSSNVLRVLPAHKDVVLIDFISEGKYGGYFKVSVYGLTGYIHRNSVNYDDAFYLALNVTDGNVNEIYMANKEKVEKLNKRKKYEEGLWESDIRLKSEALEKEAKTRGFDSVASMRNFDEEKKKQAASIAAEKKAAQEAIAKKTAEVTETKSENPTNRETNSNSSYTSNVSKVIQMRKMPSGTFEIPCKVNGLALKFIFDTGASDVSISMTEAIFMLKNGYLSEDDIMGTQYYSIANGDIAEGTTIRIRKLEFGGLTLYNVDASIVHELEAPLLLGQSAISRLGKIQIDPVNSTLTIIK